MSPDKLMDDEDEIKQLKGKIELLGLLVEERQKSDGLLTAKGQLYNRHEWHALVAGIGLVGLGHLYSGVFVLVYGILMLKAVSTKVMKRDRKGLIGEISKELQYYIAGGLVTGLVFWGAGYPPPDVPLSTLELVKALLGA